MTSRLKPQKASWSLDRQTERQSKATKKGKGFIQQGTDERGAKEERSNETEAATAAEVSQSEKKPLWRLDYDFDDDDCSVLDQFRASVVYLKIKPVAALPNG